MSLRNSHSLGSAAKRFATPILCYVTDRRSLPPAPEADLCTLLPRKIDAISLGGIDWVQIREKDLSGKAVSLLTREVLARVARLAGYARSLPRVIVNDRLDVALAEHAGGVHLGESSLPLAEAQHLAQASQAAPSGANDFLFGVSCHSLDSAKSAAGAGAGYIFFGPVFATPSKAAYGAPQGLQRLAEVCAAVNVPVLAIGGITLENIGSCFSAGASGIAAVRLFQDARDPAAVVRAIRREFS